jgi:predicted SnoaL-like aldol condensation-catalyzing enzyme
MKEQQHDQRLHAIHAFLEGLTEDDVEKMPFAPDIILASPLDPEHPLIGKEAAIAFLKNRVFPRIPVRKAEVERHIVDGDCVGTLWKATFAPKGGKEIVVPIFDFFRIVDGRIKELRPYFDPKPLIEQS